MRDLEIKVRALGYHLEEGELSSASAAKEVIAHFQSYLVKANERIAELESQLQITTLTTHEASFESDYGKKRLNKFAIEQKIESLEELHSFFLNEFDWKFPDETHVKFTDVGAAIDARIAQLRKEQGSE